MKARRNKLVTVAIAIAAGGSLVSCSSNGTSGTGDGTTREKTLTFVEYSEPPTLDPAVATDGEAGKIIQNVYDRLVRVAVDGQKIEPGVAESWTVSTDRRTYTFNLRADAKFTDGTPVDAEAARYSLQRVLAVGKGDSNNLAPRLGAADIKAVNARTVTMRLKHPYPGFLQLLGYFNIGSIVNPKEVKAKATPSDPWAQKYLDDNVAGGGAFTFVKWVRKQYIEVKRNPAYWRGPAKLARVVFKVGGDPSAQQLALQRGDVDIVEQLPANVLTSLANNKDVQVLRFPAAESTYWVFNNSIKPFDDPRVRQALSYAVDYDGIMKNVVAGAGNQMKGPLPEMLAEFNPAVTVYRRDLVKAKELLAQAGHAKGLSISTEYVDVANLKQIAQILQANFKEIGVRLDLKAKPYPQMLEDVSQGKAAMFPWLTNPPVAEPHTILWSKFSNASGSSPAGNFTHYRNTQVDQLLDGAERAETTKAVEAYKQAQALVAQDAPWIFLYNTTNQLAARRTVTGFQQPVVGQPSFWEVDVTK